jgi:hypothetical protein
MSWYNGGKLDAIYEQFQGLNRFEIDVKKDMVKDPFMAIEGAWEDVVAPEFRAWVCLSPVRITSSSTSSLLSTANTTRH